MKKLHLTVVALALAILIPLQGCVSLERSPITGKKRAYGYSWDEEIKLGREADQEIIAQYGVYDDPELTAYVDKIGQELVVVSHLERDETDPKFRDTEFTFRVLDSPVVNAFALPGGYCYVTRGLLGHLENEAQLAVVLGHEIGHVAARHASQRAAEQQLGQIAIIGGAVVGQSLGLDGGNLLQLSGQAAQLLFLSYSREDERESDALGVEYSAMQKYQAAEGGEFFTSLKRISKKSGFSIPSHLSSHPDPGEREKTIPRLAATWAERGYEQTIIGKEKFYSMINGIMYGENPRHGFVRDNYFYHPDLAFEFEVPSGFGVANQPTQVVLYNEEQSAITIFSIDAASENARQSVSTFMAQDGISTIRSSEINANGYEGYQSEGSAKVEGGSLSLLVSAVEYQDNVYRFVSYTESSNYADYKDAFGLMPVSFNSLDDEEILNIQPLRLEQIKISKSGTIDEVIPSELPMDVVPLDVAILNQVEMDEVLEAGRIIKIPVQK
jgi:predicted Zn-dependent protease